MARTKSAASPKRRHETEPRTRAFGLELENLIGDNLRRAHGVQKSRFSAVFGPLGIRPVTLSLLGTVHDHPGIAQTDLGERLHIKRANMVPLLAELSARGLIVRRPSKTDRRAQLVDLTEAGKTLTGELLAAAPEARDRPRADTRRARKRTAARALAEVQGAFATARPRRQLSAAAQAVASQTQLA